MKKIIFLIVLSFYSIVPSLAQVNSEGNVAAVSEQTAFKFEEKFENQQLKLNTIGRGSGEVNNGVLTTKGLYATFGKPEWSDYEINFKARSPKTAEHVQIWAGFRATSRNDRYVIGFQGGLLNELYLGRMGYMGTDDLLGLANLGFHPETGIWYDFKIVVCKNRIQVYINNESIPRIDVLDTNSKLAPTGEVILGGGWLEAEYDNLSVKSIASNYLANVKVQVYENKATIKEKEEKREAERTSYKPLEIKNLTASRTEISLDGNWLFMPTYELDNSDSAISPKINDDKWHVMSVPNFWNPIRIWLHGEGMGDFPKGVSDSYFLQETKRCEEYTFDYKKTKAAWYRQWVDLPENSKGKNMTLVFDAVSKVAEVYINGTKAGANVGMFGEFTVDGSKLFKPGKNLVTVKVTRDFVENIEDADKIVDVAVTVPVTNKMLKDIAHGFYKEDPAGIWQPVHLIITEPLRINDVFIKPSLTGASFDVTIKNNGTKKAKFSINTFITDKVSLQELYNGVNLISMELKPGEEKVLNYSIDGLKPKLWSPNSPNLYDFTFTIVNGKNEIDKTTICSGFRTFESKNGFLYLNGIQYWLRGGNQTPFALAPNDEKLANTFYQLMKAGNIDVTRTHTTPYNELWMDAADKNGIGISFEGTWPWLMTSSSMPDAKFLDLWADEFLGLLKKYRNHPSLLLWTVNNEMKFYGNEPNLDIAKLKMKIISDVVKKMRIIDPTRPVCFDSNYIRNEKKFGTDFFKTIDDGDIDDKHEYTNWYHKSIFEHFNGEFQEQKNIGRPFISQEMSTGYPSSETGHPTRSYTLIHQNPQVFVGNEAYAFGNPNAFLTTQSFITGELAEALRRTNDKASGVLHFALITWFRNVHDADKIKPYPTYFAVKRALQPVLVSAELWGRNFYYGDKLPVRICVVNDKEDGSVQQATTLVWKIVDEKNSIVATGNESFPAVAHYGRQWIAPTIVIPETFDSQKTNGKLILELIENDTIVSQNEYNLLFSKKSWVQSTFANKKIVLVDYNNINKALEFVGIKGIQSATVTEALKTKADLYIFSGLDTSKNVSLIETDAIRKLILKGAKVLLLNAPNAAKAMFPEYVTGWIVPTEGDVANLEIPESNVFDGIDVLDLRYFNNNKRELPKVCYESYKVNRNPKLELLASQAQIHSYLNGGMKERSEYLSTIKGFPLLKLNDNGSIIISSMAIEKSPTDPISAKLLLNMVNNLLKP